MYAISKLIVVTTILLGAALCQSITYTDWQIRNYQQIRKIYDNVQWPKNTQIILSGQPPPGLFVANVSGRINPIANFTDSKGLMEYFYALTPNITNNPTGAALGNLTIVGFSSMCPEVAAFSGYVPIYINATKQVVGHIAQQGFFKFDANGLITHYDLILESFQEVMDIIFGVDFTSRIDQIGAIVELCKVAASRYKRLHKVVIAHSTSCPGQYGSLLVPDFEACVLHLLAKPFGYFWDAWSDTVACRILHAVLAQVDPVEHCPHVGPTGGGKCVSYPYENKYFKDNTQLFGSQSPFVCPGFG